MSISAEEKIILSKITVLTNKIKSFLQEVGCSQKEKAIYFSKKIFSNKSELKQKQSINEFYKQQINAYLSSSIKEHGCARIALIHILTKLQIENGQIEKYQIQFQQQKNTSKLTQKRHILSNEQSAYKPRKLFEMLLSREQSEDNSKVIKDLDQIKSFEKELQENLFKTKLLKRMIQQRLADDLEQPFGRSINAFEKLLTLEGSG